MNHIDNKTPNVVFIGAKETGKTTTISKLWHINNEKKHISEFIKGRGQITYDVIELPYVSFSLESDINKWIYEKSNHDYLINADVIVFLLPIDNITFGKKAKLIKKLQDSKSIKNNVYFIIGLSQVEDYIDIFKNKEEFCLTLNDCSRIIDKQIAFFKEFKKNVINEEFDISHIIPFSYLIDWQIEILRNAIVDGVIRRHNELIYDEKCPTIVFIGKTGCGKSSTINTLCGTDLPVDEAVACTKYPIVINKIIEYENKTIRVNIVDLPGIAESLEANNIYYEYYNKYIKAANVIVCLSQANTRAYKQDEEFYMDLIDIGIINKHSHVILAINKIDLLFKSENSLNGIDLSTINDDAPLIKDKIDDYYERVFSPIFHRVKNVNRDSVIVYSNLQKWNIKKLNQKLFANL